MTQWNIGSDSGELLIRTGVTGRAATIGHRLTIALKSWHAVAEWDGEKPVGLELTIDLTSLTVLRGQGGVTPLSGAEKTVVTANAVKALRVHRYPQARFVSDAVEAVDDAFRLSGTLHLNGRTAAQTVDVRVEPSDSAWRVTGRAEVRHSDFGLKQYSMLMGAMKVADEVQVTLAATVARPDA